MQTAQRIMHFQESVIRKMTRLATEHQAINLSQGFPDFDPPLALKEAAAKAVMDGSNQYSPTWGHPHLRQKLAEQYTARLGWSVNPNDHVIVTCGVTEAINAALLAVLNPGDELLIVEPAHENYIPSAIFAGAKPVAVPLEAPDYRLDPERLAHAVTSRTRALLLNTPHNPTGRVFDAEELARVADLVLRHDLVLITDEIYDQIIYDGRQHIFPGSLESLRERTITVGGLGKTFAITGWRLGYVIAPTRLTAQCRAFGQLAQRLFKILRRIDQGDDRVCFDAELFHERSARVRSKARLWHDDIFQGMGHHALQRAANPAPLGVDRVRQELLDARHLIGAALDKDQRHVTRRLVLA